MIVPKFSGARFLETAIVVVVVLIALDMVPALRFWTRWTSRPATTA